MCPTPIAAAAAAALATATTIEPTSKPQQPEPAAAKLPAVPTTERANHEAEAEGEGEATPVKLSTLSGTPAIIDALNAQTRRRAKRELEERGMGKDHADYMCFELVSQGAPVFKHRAMWLLPIFWGFSAFGILAAPSLPFLLGALALTYIYIEFYGAVLHVVLDNPLNLTLPVIWEPCLEFQWHHFVAHEICVRSYAQIAADINLIVLIHFAAAHLAFLPCGGLGNPYVRTLVCCGVACAYLLQFAHRQAHFPKSQRHPVASVMQKWGLLVSEEMHRAHHRTFDTGFPVLSGLSDPLINAMHALVPNRWIWLASFAALTFGGIQALTLAYLAAYRAISGDAAAVATLVFQQ